MKNGFTLAEVLITLGIIGVVAAMTIPTLVANYQKKVLVAKLQQTISLVSNAAKLLMAEEQTFNLNQTYLRETTVNANHEDERNARRKFLETYFKISKMCEYANRNECIAENYKSLDGNEGDFGGDTCGILNNGAVICIGLFNQYSPFHINIDVNGKSGPNVLGRDAFQLSMNYNGAIAESFDKDQYGHQLHDPEQCGSDNFEAQLYGLGCYNKIVQDGWKMDY